MMLCEGRAGAEPRADYSRSRLVFWYFYTIFGFYAFCDFLFFFYFLVFGYFPLFQREHYYRSSERWGSDEPDGSGRGPRQGFQPPSIFRPARSRDREPVRLHGNGLELCARSGDGSPGPRIRFPFWSPDSDRAPNDLAKVRSNSPDPAPNPG